MAQDKKWCLDSAEVLQVLNDYEKLEYLEKKDSLAEINDSLYRSQIAGLKKVNENLQQINFNLEESIYMLKSSMVTAIPPLIKWQGFFAGIGTMYEFDSNIIRSTITGKLKDGLFIYGSARITVLDKAELIGEAGIPFHGKFYLRAKIGWKLF